MRSLLLCWRSCIVGTAAATLDGIAIEFPNGTAMRAGTQQLLDEGERRLVVTRDRAEERSSTYGHARLLRVQPDSSHDKETRGKSEEFFSGESLPERLALWSLSFVTTQHTYDHQTCVPLCGSLRQLEPRSFVGFGWTQVSFTVPDSPGEDSARH